jgi:ketosteroid isomerase-like protein
MSDRIREIQKFVEHLYELTGTGNWSEVEKFLTEDFFVTEAATLPYAGVYRGKGALKELYTKVMSMMDVADLKIHETTVGHDYAVTLLDMVFAGSPPVSAPLAEMFRFRDGKVCEIRPYYFDTTPIVKACEAKARSKR